MSLSGVTYKAKGKPGKTIKNDEIGRSIKKKEHERWLFKNNVHSSQIKERMKTRLKPIKNIIQISKLTTPDLNNIGVTGLVKETNKYTGKNLLGIAVMHKSNIVPVFSQQEASDIANMRRG